MMLWNPKRVFRDAVFAWGGLLVAILGASFLYAVLVVRRAPETIQLALPFGAMLAFLLSLYPPLKLHKRIWSRLQEQAVELWLEWDSWEGRSFVWMLVVTVVLLLPATSEGTLSIVQILLFLPLLFTSVVIAAQWFDLIALAWDNKSSEQREKQIWNWKMLFLLISLLVSAIARWMSQDVWERGWMLLMKVILGVLALPLATSLLLLIALIRALGLWDLAQARRLLEIVKRIGVLRQKLAKTGEIKQRKKLRLALRLELGLAIGIVLALAITVPILVLAHLLKSESES